VSDWLVNAEDSVILKDPENARELSEAIRMLASNSSLRGAIAASAWQTAKKFSWAAHTSELRKLMAKAVLAKSHCTLPDKSA